MSIKNNFLTLFLLLWVASLAYSQNRFAIGSIFNLTKGNIATVEFPSRKLDFTDRGNGMALGLAGLYETRFNMVDDGRTGLQLDSLWHDLSAKRLETSGRGDVTTSAQLSGVFQTAVTVCIDGGYCWEKVSREIPYIFYGWF